MKTAIAKGFVSAGPEPSTSVLNRVLLIAMLAARGESIASIPSKSARLKLYKESVGALSVLQSKVRDQFREWIKSPKSEYLPGPVTAACLSCKSPQEIFNALGSFLFDEEAAKARGAIFTPAWIARRLVNTASGCWCRLNPGKQPSIAGDLSCGPGVFLAELASKLPKKTRIIGVDNSPEYVALARLLTSRWNNVDVEAADTLLTLRSFGQLTLGSDPSSVPSNGYNIIVGNPPYVRCQSLDTEYSKLLREVYPSFTAGNFDLASLFLAHTLEALAPGGVAALLISSKFMTSRYGAEICRRIGQQARVLEIIDFGDGQVFDGRTTYTCTLTFAKLSPQGSCKVFRFPSGLKWDDTESHMSEAKTAELPAERFQRAPWQLSSGVHDNILSLMRSPECPRLPEVFPNVSQGIRTGANQFFVIPKSMATELEPGVVLPYISGENIRSCRILPPELALIWPYRFTETGAVVAIREDELFGSYPRVASYFSQLRSNLALRELEAGAPWYSYSRSQNLDLAQRPKIVGRELMPKAEFAADEDGSYAICSGYALLPPLGMPKAELRMWAAVLSSRTMEFQLRHACTQLHSGWFRILKHHLNAVHLPPFSTGERSLAITLADQLHENPDDCVLKDRLDCIVSSAFRLTDAQRSQIHSHVGQHHRVSMPKSLFEGGGDLGEGEESSRRNTLSGSLELALSREDRNKYLPVELPEYYRLHVERENLRQAVTFVENKSEPIHRWYGFTQGFSTTLVAELIKEVEASSRSRIYDPFAGSGTTLLTCKEMGISSVGSEISPLMCWITRQKTSIWDPTRLARAARSLEESTPDPRSEPPKVFQEFFAQAYAPKILEQVFGWRDLINVRFESPIRDFLLLALISILEGVSQLRKHGSHYRFLNKADSVGLAKLNIPVISSSAELRPILLDQVGKMISDIEVVKFRKSPVSSEMFNLDSRFETPTGVPANIVITSPPYLNRNMYFAQQKAELAVLNFIQSYDEYRLLVNRTFRSHVEGKLPEVARSGIPEVQAIVDKIRLSENNNAKIPQMVCGYFADLDQTLATLRGFLSANARLAFVVGNCRWGGVVVPVDHLLVLIAERLGYRAERIIVTRLKGNSPQQMRMYGRIPQRESIVLLRWPGEV